MTVSREELQRRLELYHKVGTYTGSAELAGVTEATMRRSVATATRMNMGGDFMGGEVPPGYVLGKVTTLQGPDGTVMEWQHKLPEIEALQSTIDHLIEVMGAEIEPIPEIERPLPMGGWVDTWLTVYPLADVHLGQYSWGKESGANYDLDIAKRQFQTSVARLVAMSPTSGTALIEVLGDYYHADNNDATTHRSGNHLDVDGRHDKVLFVGVELIIWTIDKALAKHDHVEVHVSEGNHDEYASLALLAALWFRYENNPRVTINRDPKSLWSFRWGVNMLAFTHGHKVKAEEMPGVMAAQWPQMWGETTYRYAYSGHYHKNKKSLGGDERHGAEWEIIPAFTEKDAWNYEMGHTAKRELRSITFDYNEGRVFSNFVAVR